MEHENRIPSRLERCLLNCPTATNCSTRLACYSNAAFSKLVLTLVHDIVLIGFARANFLASNISLWLWTMDGSGLSQLLLNELSCPDITPTAGVRDHYGPNLALATPLSLQEVRPAT